LYLDPDFRLPCCHDDHELVHDDWYTLELANVAGPLTVFDRNELRCRRAAVVFARAAEQNPDDPLFGPLARALVGWADEQARGIRRLDERYPDCRSDPGLYPPADEQTGTSPSGSARAATARGPGLDDTQPRRR
jgi:hypothetical protein